MSMFLRTGSWATPFVMSANGNLSIFSSTARTDSFERCCRTSRVMSRSPVGSGSELLVVPLDETGHDVYPDGHSGFPYLARIR
jgi:hypothetical protein